MNNTHHAFEPLLEEPVHEQADWMGPNGAGGERPGSAPTVLGGPQAEGTDGD